jgi:hypothetical protein
MVGSDPEVIEVARRDLAGGRCRTPATRVPEAAAKLQEWARKIEGMVASGADPKPNGLPGVFAEIRAITATFVEPVNAIEAKSE